MKKELSFAFYLFQGAIGKRLVCKHYRKGGIVLTKYPNMKDIIPSTKQKRQRRLFKLAVQYAKAIFQDAVKKEQKYREMRRPRRMFQKLMKEWFSKREDRQLRNRRRLHTWQRNVERNKGMKWIPVSDKTATPPIVGDCFVVPPRNDGQYVCTVSLTIGCSYRSLLRRDDSLRVEMTNCKLAFPLAHRQIALFTHSLRAPLCLRVFVVHYARWLIRKDRYN
ncbi:MAG TPA: hypothetical protein VHK91_10710 [Flavisolibacter sp.]|jgi:hypothetical protein|nr:hypothetical protein [Flavisolibacter sp.]